MNFTKIEKILINIIDNATKYTNIGKIKLSVTSNMDKDNQILRFVVSDTGQGIKDDKKQFIFSDNQEESGGIGLSLIKRYVSAMNGTISFDSVYEAGTTFTVDIPQKTIGTRKIIEDKSSEEKGNAIEYIDCSNYKVLLVDDDMFDIKVTTKLIEKYKFKITAITSPLECINMIKQEQQFDILFLDHKMHGVDGIKTMKVIKSLEGYKVPKIVALSANAVSGAREYYLNEGFDDYLSKPIDIHELDRIIKKNYNVKINLKF